MSHNVDSALPGDLIILMYHHVAEPPPQAPVRGLYVTPKQFAWQLDWLLARQVRFCTFSTFADKRTPLQSGPWVMVTFDDGYRDVYEKAWPLLRERKIPAVVYPVVGDLGKRGVVWPESEDQTPANVLTAGEVQEMSTAGAEFGSHLMDHVHADRLSTLALQRQLVDSSQALGRIVGSPIVSIAYPYGTYTLEIARAASEAGYRFGVTTRTGSNRDAPAMELRRVAIKGTRWHHRWRFARRLTQELARARLAS